MIYRILFFLSVSLISNLIQAQSSFYISNKAPLAPLKYIELPLGTIKPKGWLHNQLTIMRNGTTGHLDEYYPKIMNDNGWLGGEGDAWEETPYWLDGALPLAYLLDDKELKIKVQKYVNWVIENQRPNGYIGGITKEERSGKTLTNCQQGEDWWPKMVMIKVLQQYYTATNDKRVIKCLTNYFKYQYQNLKTCPLVKWTEWAQARGGDNLMSVYWLYNITEDKFLLELGDIIYQQTTPWTQLLGNRNWVMQAAANQTNEKWMERHAVNVGMGIKLPAIYFQAKKNPELLKSLKTGWTDLMTLHGLPHGMYSGDEDLHGNDPTQGIELCSIVETMFSLEQMIGISGDQTYMEAIERMTYNALPTQTTDDYNSRQYFQIANQVQVSRGIFDFSLPFWRGMCNVFGPYAGYTCCTANMHQGWTKFTSHLWYATPDKGLAALLFAPSTITAKVGSGTVVTIDEETNYPFEDQINFTITTPKSIDFPLEVRIPAWCKEAIVWLNGKKFQTEKGGKIIKIKRFWTNGDKLTLQLPMEVITTNWAKNSRAIERGPLVYALKIKEEWTKKEIKEEGIYYDIQPKSDWNYGLPLSVIQKTPENVTVTIKPKTDAFVWNSENAPIEIKTVGKKIPSWKIVEGVARQPVTARDGVYLGEVNEDAETITLIPYGCSKLRIVAFPVVK
ncbi:beta-L-arabinofuranosidase domain-containing protein [Emticicia sp. BO119]|uniref:beta-L-arabinofuranosidase domain-containing protein n=1 Tax=Emticicia sp. BO119 TaxID=2757768 RepID=UPI0015F044B6|nr:beta-L-arabinofuranosidase domain-containing protein [Emticicia sp. BO119]MBA4853624.1 glycoside hydrolase family 127 protein [Emticicia sp. BO119]